MGCKGEAKTSFIEHSAALGARDCILRSGPGQMIDHSFASKTPDFWTGKVEVNEVPGGQGIFFGGATADSFQVDILPATNYLLGLFLMKSERTTVKRSVELQMSDRKVLGNGAAIEVSTVWSLGGRTETTSFKVPFMVRP